MRAVERVRGHALLREMSIVVVLTLALLSTAESHAAPASADVRLCNATPSAVLPQQTMTCVISPLRYAVAEIVFSASGRRPPASPWRAAAAAAASVADGPGTSSRGTRKPQHKANERGQDGSAWTRSFLWSRLGDGLKHVVFGVIPSASRLYLMPSGLLAIFQRTHVLVAAQQEMTAVTGARLWGQFVPSVRSWQPVCAAAAAAATTATATTNDASYMRANDTSSSGATSNPNTSPSPSMRANCSCALPPTEWQEQCSRPSYLVGPSWVSWLLGQGPARSTLETFYGIEAAAADDSGADSGGSGGGMGSGEGQQAEKAGSLCTIEAPAIVPLCVRVENAGGSGSGLRVTIRHETRPDGAFFQLLLALVAVRFFTPYFVRYRALQVAAAAVLGTLLFSLYVLWVLLNDMRRSKLGKIGLVGIVSIGGLAALSEGLVNSIATLALVELERNPVVQVALLGFGGISAALSYIFFAPLLPQMARTLCVGAQLVLVASLLIRNREGFVLMVLLWFGLDAARQPRLAALLLRGCRAVARLAIGSDGDESDGGEEGEEDDDAHDEAREWQHPRGAIDPGMFDFHRHGGACVPPGGDPEDHLPRSAFREPGVVRPLCANAIDGRNPLNKLDRFDRDGRVFTRRAMEVLARHVRREGIEAYAQRLMDPHGVVRWACGGGGGGGGDNSGEDSDA